MARMSADPSSALPDARPYIDSLLARALAEGASDIHIEPTAAGADVRLRVDGLLQSADHLPLDLGRGAVLRLMVLAQLLTYRLDSPQEGRIAWAPPAGSANAVRQELRLAIMPTARGLRAVVRLPADLSQPRLLGDLGLPPQPLEVLHRFARADGGMLLVTGPAGSGKTTTIYALLEYIAAESAGLSVISLEDPVERLLPGVTQIEVSPHGQLTYERALKSILRQDPQVLMLGEIRDAATASVAVQAALSGHRLIATLHAGEPATAVARLLEMGIEPYQLTSSVFGILTQRLVRKLTGSGHESPDARQTSTKTAQRYRGRVPIAEFAQFDGTARAAVLRRADADQLRTIFGAQPGHASMRIIAEELAAGGITDAAEIQRVLGE
jgi:type II secretory ATPase GspE/PulE/Tfp pilus assembly ATPase PilB-like protein